MTSSFYKYLTDKTFQFGSIVFIWTIIQAMLLWKFGINTEGESVKYFRESDLYIQNGSFSSPKYWLYSVYIYLHIFFKWLGFEIVGLYIFQSLFFIGSILFFFKTVSAFNIHSILPYISALFLAICYPIHEINTYLYTDSLFISLSIIWASLILLSYDQKKYWIPLVLITIIMLFTRPTGIYFLILLGLWSILQLSNNKNSINKIVLAIILLICLSLFTVDYLMQLGGELNFWLPYEEKHIICGVPTGSLSIDDGFKKHIFYLSRVFFEYPKEISLLFIERLLSFWKMTRAHYSNAHNWMLILLFYPLFIMSFYSFRNWRNNRLLPFIICGVILFTTAVMVSCDDWMNRFMLPSIPLLLLSINVYKLKKS